MYHVLWIEYNQTFENLLTSYNMNSYITLQYAELRFTAQTVAGFSFYAFSLDTTIFHGDDIN